MLFNNRLKNKVILQDILLRTFLKTYVQEFCFFAFTGDVPPVELLPSTLTDMLKGIRKRGKGVSVHAMKITAVLFNSYRP